jgi:Smg protein
MKENVLDVLMYLFENFMNSESGPEADQDSLRQELEEAGFHRSEIHKAFTWLEGLAEQQSEPPPGIACGTAALRVFTDQEIKKLDLECRGFLLFLEQVGVLDGCMRELVIDRVMALDSDEIDIDQFKWIVLMVLFNQPGQEAAVAWMEDLMFEGPGGSLH